jgi:hypothetical protein
MAAVMESHALDAEDPAYMSEAQLEEIEFYAGLSPTGALPLLAVSGVSWKGIWIGSLPVPPEEEASEDEDSGDESADEETKELLASRHLHPPRVSLCLSLRRRLPSSETDLPPRSRVPFPVARGVPTPHTRPSPSTLHSDLAPLLPIS